jgi:para-aminobenzoate synthetase/4-amino-4-deoxychorismate lyase
VVDWKKTRKRKVNDVTVWKQQPFLLFDFAAEEGRPERLCFFHPVRVWEARRVEEVLPVLRAVEEGVREGYYAAGYLAYEAAPAFDPAYQVRERGDESLPLAWFGLFREAHREIRVDEGGAYCLTAWRASVTRDAYTRAIHTIREAISRGETYQVNYTLRLHAEFAGNDLAFYHRLTAAQQADFSAYLHLGRYRILSASPELFFRKRGGQLVTKPMKGTARRGRFPEEDRMQRDELYHSEKNRAENLMIVDLLRNDLSRLAQTGTVEVPRLFETERYPTVWQMTSTVTAGISPQTPLSEILGALFPCGSITGAPKVKTMEWIARLEDSPRGVYCGTIGFVQPDGDMTWNVAIRTVVIDTQTGRAEYGTGGGVTLDSTAEGEYQEALDKAALLTEERPSFELLETMRLENGRYWLRERHITRMCASAEYFGIPLARPDVEEALDQHAAEYEEGTRRVRLLVSRAGQVRIESVPFTPVSAAESLPVRLASQAIDSSQVFLYHKTTHRTVYEKRREGQEDVFDVLLQNERGELTEFTLGNLVVEIGGQKWTPARTCGLLAGTFRQELLEKGEIRERILTPADLTRADRIWLINSVRGWVPVHLVEEKNRG